MAAWELSQSQARHERQTGRGAPQASCSPVARSKTRSAMTPAKR